MYLDHIVEVYNTTLPITAKGYDQAAIATAEDILGVRFPAAYREFLATLARGFHPWAGSDFSPGLLPELQEWAQETLAEGTHQPPWPDDALVFEQNGGNEFNFFRLSEGDDPPVYYYYVTQEDAAFQQTAPTFSAFVADSLTYYLDLKKIPIQPYLALPPEGGEGRAARPRWQRLCLLSASAGDDPPKPLDQTGQA